ncbi:DNA glycosylase [Phellopilus nigrolimitatus]|nr:DNA glycosylase [Phellopilus nigrolimitatus]
MSTTDSDADSDFKEEIKSRRPPKRKRTKKERSDDEYDHDREVEREKTTSHPVTLHVIKDPIPIRISLLDWYSGVHENRGMPWRKPFDPTLDAESRSQRAYEVWISEIMLQQTQVVTVIPYYNRWIEKYPTIRDLADSDIESVNALWKGLGYYSRAARILSGAQKIVKECNGLFPDNAKDMMANVPGIGRYSAGAISSIAYNHCEPVLDGNVNRLLSRVLALHANPKAKSTLDILWDGASVMIKKAEQPGNINQALIELGATICKPRDPDCKVCPLNAHCGAFLESQGRLRDEQDIEELCTLCEPILPGEDAGVTRYPMKVERKKAREEVDVVNVVEWLSPQGARYFLLVRRPEKGLLAGLHEFPSRANVKDSDSSLALRTIGHDVLGEVLADPPPPYQSAGAKSKKKTPSAESNSLQITKMKPAGDVLHIFSHIRKTYRAQWILLEGGERPPSLSAGYALMTSDDVNGKKSKNKKSKIQKREEEPTETGGLLARKEQALRWVEFKDVENANVGTGMVKVWKKINDVY